jgi:hypothetical protein
MAPTNIFVPGAPAIGRNKRRVSYGLGASVDPNIASLAAKISSFWTMDEASGNRADSVGGFTLTQVGTVGQTTGINGSAAVISTGNYFGTVSTAAVQTGNIDFTVALRVYPTTTTGPKTIAAKGISTSTSTIEWGVVINASGLFEFNLWQAGSAQVLAATTFGAPTANQWYDVICWVDTTANTINIEVNGIGNSATKTKTPVAGTAALGIGAYGNGNSNIFGYLDDVTFSKAKWTAGERKVWRSATYPFTTTRGIYESGQLYTSWQQPVSGTNMDILIPTKRDLSGTMVLYCHGSGEVANVWETDSLKAGIRDALLNAGHILCASLAGGNLWGNDASNTHYVNLYNQVTSRFTINRVLMIAQSMGGSSGFKIVADNLIPNIKGLYCIYPVSNLANMYGNASYTTAIQTAYGIPGTGTYATQTAGHDPVLFTSAQLQRFTMPVRFTHSYADTVVPRAQHTDIFQPLIAPYAPESGIITSTGDHGDPSNFIPSDVVSFFSRCV